MSPAIASKAVVTLCVAMRVESSCLGFGLWFGFGLGFGFGFGFGLGLGVAMRAESACCQPSEDVSTMCSAPRALVTVRIGVRVGGGGRVRVRVRGRVGSP